MFSWNRYIPIPKALISAVPVPDPSIKRNEIPIKGEVPLTPTKLPSGCRFQPRCPYSMRMCGEEQPSITEVEAGHKVACSRARIKEGKANFSLGVCPYTGAKLRDYGFEGFSIWTKEDIENIN